MTIKHPESGYGVYDAYEEYWLTICGNYEDADFIVDCVNKYEADVDADYAREEYDPLDEKFSSLQ